MIDTVSLSLRFLNASYWIQIVCVMAGFVFLAGTVEGYFSRELGYLERLFLVILVLLLFASLARPMLGLVLVGLAMAAMIWRFHAAARA